VEQIRSIGYGIRSLTEADYLTAIQDLQARGDMNDAIERLVPFIAGSSLPNPNDLRSQPASHF